MTWNDIYRRVVIYLFIITTVTETIDGYAIRLDRRPVDGGISGDVLRLDDVVNGNSAEVDVAVLQRGDAVDIKTDTISRNILRVGGLAGQVLRLSDDAGDRNVKISELVERVLHLDDDVDDDLDSEHEVEIGGNSVRLGDDTDDVNLDYVVVHLKDTGSTGIGNLQQYVDLT